MTTPVLPKLIGERVKRREDPRLIQGRATYVDDIKIAGMLHMAFKRSDIAHGRIRSVDTSAAEAMRGVESPGKQQTGEREYVSNCAAGSVSPTGQAT